MNCRIDKYKYTFFSDYFFEKSDYYQNPFINCFAIIFKMQSLCLAATFYCEDEYKGII